MYGVIMIMLFIALICVEAQDWSDIRDYENRNVESRTR